jgi:hypothetical protein
MHQIAIRANSPLESAATLLLGHLQVSLRLSELSNPERVQSPNVEPLELSHVRVTTDRDAKIGLVHLRHARAHLNELPRVFGVWRLEPI